LHEQAAHRGNLQVMGSARMAIIVAEETTFPLAETPKHIPPRRGGRKLHQATAFRWAKHGVRGVKLETIRIGGTLCTSVEALQRFFERLSATDGPSEAAPSIRTPAARARAIAKAEAELAKLGV
jgi:hypothetical protein